MSNRDYSNAKDIISNINVEYILYFICRMHKSPVKEEKKNKIAFFKKILQI